MDEVANTTSVDSPPQSRFMDEQIEVIAGETLKALWGHTILVDGQYMRIGDDGRLSVTPAMAQRLLKQSGWAKVSPPKQDAGEKLDEVDDTSVEQEPNESPYRGGKNRKKRR